MEIRKLINFLIDFWSAIHTTHTYGAHIRQEHTNTLRALTDGYIDCIESIPLKENKLREH